MHITAQIQAAKKSGQRRLTLSCGLSEFPDEIFQLADTLEILDLSNNQLSALPDDLYRLHKLRILFCSNNRFSELPAVLGKCPNLTMVGFKANHINMVPAAALGKALRWLILTDNQISELPAEIGSCSQLQKLMLSGNRLQHLPDTLAACSKLELLRIAANRFHALPAWLLSLPRLSWLAYAGNPCAALHETTAEKNNPIALIPWQHMELQHKLGEGASGVIHQALWINDTASPIKVALKLFKGSMTSDGLPQSEETACISAGAHPNLITVHGKISAHPAGMSGLVLSLINPAFRNLAAPPSLESCTRDLYPEHSQYPLDTILNIACGIASAAKQLHDRGIMHGDLYAHNILHDDEGNCLLGDFGAASFYAAQEKAIAEALQRIEVRAFGCLLGELLERCTANRNEQATVASLKLLQKTCMQENAATRPLFADILQLIIGLREQQPYAQN